MVKANILRLMLVMIVLSIGALPLAACNTIQGAGQDIEKAGSKIQNEAQEHKHY